MLETRHASFSLKTRKSPYERSSEYRLGARIVEIKLPFGKEQPES
jgi:hypothetical protein